MTALAVPAAVVSLASSCPATPVHGEPLPRSGSLSSLRWVQATPHRAGIVGVLFGYDPALEPVGALPTFALWAHGQKPGPNGWSMKILWIVRHPGTLSGIAVRGRRLDGPGSFRKSFSRVTDASPHPAKRVEYASIVVVPAAGCWRLDVASGAARGHLVARVVG
jgi:hypothetical protein